jgi:hypothetical protein
MSVAARFLMTCFWGGAGGDLPERHLPLFADCMERLRIEVDAHGEASEEVIQWEIAEAAIPDTAKLEELIVSLAVTREEEASLRRDIGFCARNTIRWSLNARVKFVRAIDCSTKLPKSGRRTKLLAASSFMPRDVAKHCSDLDNPCVNAMLRALRCWLRNHSEIVAQEVFDSSCFNSSRDLCA